LDLSLQTDPIEQARWFRWIAYMLSDPRDRAAVHQYAHELQRQHERRDPEQNLSGRASSLYRGDLVHPLH
jgi:hypothetical protein